jgi:anaerobic ribonucleoside-triphosphate reductase activating protein
MQIELSRAHFPITTLGPGRRVGIWFQGCSIQCPGCVSADTWGTGRGNTSVSDVVARVAPWLRIANGITISGGEPFDQPEALAHLLRRLPLRPSQDILVFSGHPIEAIAGTAAMTDGRIDALISDPFDQATPQTLRLRGSDNQRLHLLTALGRERFKQFELPVSEEERALDVMFDADGTVWLAGIPRQDDMRRLRGVLEQAGHAITTSDATRTSNAR